MGATGFAVHRFGIEIRGNPAQESALCIGSPLLQWRSAVELLDQTFARIEDFEN